MFEFSELNYSDYVFEASLDSAPYINVNMNTASDEAIEEAANEYYHDGAGTAVDYRNSIYGKLIKRKNTRGRLEKDLMACMKTTEGDTPQSMGVVDLVANEYVANKKANELFKEASKNLSLYRESGCRTTGENCNSLFYNLFVKDSSDSGEEVGQGLIYTETEAAVQYDLEAVSGPNDENFILAVPAAEGNNRVWYSYALEGGDYVRKQMIAFDSESGKWTCSAIADASDSGSNVIATADEIDENYDEENNIYRVNWTIVEQLAQESNSPTAESSSGTEQTESNSTPNAESNSQESESGSPSESPSQEEQP